jgi:hypothetical protein
LIYVLSYVTESGDKGVAGYWTKRPSKSKQVAHMRERFPDEFFDGRPEYIFWQLESLEAQP